MASGNYIEEFLVGLGFKFEGDDGERFRKQTEVIASTINKVTMAAAAATAALYAMAKNSADQTYQLNQVATVLDTNVNALGRWKHAAEIAGVSGDSVVDMMSRLKAQAQESVRSGSGPFRAYQELAVDFQALADGGIDVADALEQIIARAQTMDREVAKGAFRELGLDERLLDTPISRMREAFGEYDQWASKSQNLIKLSGELSESQAELSLRFEGVSNMVAERALPTIIKFFDALIEGLEWLQTTGFPAMDEFAEKVGGWDKVLTALGLVALPTIIGALGKVISLLGGVTGGAAGAAAALGLMARGGALGAAGAAGWLAGGLINDQMSDETKDYIGSLVAKSLAFLGVKEAQDAVRNNEGFTIESPMDVARRHRDRINEEPERISLEEFKRVALENRNRPTLEDWLATPYDPNMPLPDFPVATEPMESMGSERLVPGPVTEADIRRPAAPAATKHITNHFHGVPLDDLEELQRKFEQEESQFMQNENTTPIVR